MEERGVPTAVIITAAFAREPEVQCAALGTDRLEAVVITHPLSTLSSDEIQARAEEAVSQIERVVVGR